MTFQLSRSLACVMLLPAFFRSLQATSAHPLNGDKPHIHRRAVAGANRLSVAVLVVIIAVVVVLVIALGGLIYIWYQRRPKPANNKPVPMPTYGQAPSGSMRQEPNWWQPSTDGHEVVSSQTHTNVPYSQGGHGYTYGTTLDPASAGAMGGTRTSATSHAPLTTEGDRPFQIPIQNSPQPSISPSYHTHVNEQTRPPLAYNPPTTGSFQARPTPPANYIQPQATGTSMYSSPYEVTAMTQSTSGHPGT